MKLIEDPNLKPGETANVHTFQSRGLGLAPYKFSGYEMKVFVACPGAEAKPGTTCDHCGTAIMHAFWFVSADGRRFKVGSSCVRKSGDSKLVKQISTAERQIRDNKNAEIRRKKAEKFQARIGIAKGNLPSLRDVLGKKPHPNAYRAESGQTMLDYVEWCFANGYNEKAVLIIESIIAE